MVMSLDFILQGVVPQQAIQWDVIQFGDLWTGMPYEGAGIWSGTQRQVGRQPMQQCRGMGGSSELRESGFPVRDR